MPVFMVDIKPTGNWNIVELTGDKVSSACSGVCERTNQSRLDILEGGALKRQ